MNIESTLPDTLQNSLQTGVRKVQELKNTKVSLPKVPKGVTESARKAWLVGLGTVSLVGETTGRIADQLGERGKVLEAKGKKTFERLVDRGVKVQKTSRKSVEQALNRAEETLEELQSGVDTRLTKVSQRLGIPHREQIRRLSDRVEELTRKVEAFQTQNGLVAPATVPMVFHIVPTKNGWAIESGKGKTPLSQHPTKDKALAAGRALAQSHEPSQLVVFKLDGKVQTSYSYGEEG
ncbi:MAG: phasin family protein [Thermoanaerobaculia bacterium]|nr:phasin family protein [Thermoanaerobaculia bacterium]